MKKIKLIALFGKSGAGKDYTLNQLIQKYPDFNRLVSDTTRPKREREVDGLDYFFLTEDEFHKKRHLEISSYNDWYYGTPFDILKRDKINIGVYDLKGLKTILTNKELDVLPIHLCVPDKTRLNRCLGRETSPNVLEICRRFIADDEEYRKLDSFPKGTIVCTDVADLIGHSEFQKFLQNK